MTAASPQGTDGRGSHACRRFAASSAERSAFCRTTRRRAASVGAGIVSIAWSRPALSPLKTSRGRSARLALSTPSAPRAPWPPRPTASLRPRLATGILAIGVGAAACAAYRSPDARVARDRAAHASRAVGRGPLRAGPRAPLRRRCTDRAPHAGPDSLQPDRLAVRSRPALTRRRVVRRCRELPARTRVRPERTPAWRTRSRRS